MRIPAWFHPRYAPAAVPLLAAWTRPASGCSAWD